ncbi:MAG: glycosyl hydrolase family 16 [Sphingobacteriales bacterium]|nr:glycosyl hydrolase family 16 [Sphingobacteriales bacterium]
MNKSTFNILGWFVPAGIFALLLFGCERDITDLDTATYPTNPEVFINGFSGGLNYAAFGGSVPTAFNVDNEVTLNNSAAAMRFEVPDYNDPRGAYAGGTYFTGVGRDLSGYNALTFWAKASKDASLDVVGFGNDLGANRYTVSINGLNVNTNWKQYIIPIPDPSKLNTERGMFFYSEGPEDEKGYTFWIDEVKFEKLGTITKPTAAILNGQDNTVTAEIGENITLTGLTATANLPSGVDQSVNPTPYYYTFTSSNTSVATVSETGIVTIVGAGDAIITAQMGNTAASGSLTINSVGAAIQPSAAAPTPTVDASKVISMFSNAYTNVPVDTWNTRWLYSTAEEFYVQIAGDDVIRYRNLNFVGIEFTSQTIDATNMTHFHLDIWTPDPTNAPKNFKVQLVDFGANNTYGGGDDVSHEITITAPVLATQSWVSINIPLSNFSGLTSRAHLAQLVLSGDLPNVYLDNVYFYNSATPPAVPTTAAPTPTDSPANVISVFSNAFTNIPATDLNPNWGQGTVVTQVAIAGNNTLKYAGLNYQGIQLGSNQNISTKQFLHLDYWTANSSSLKVYLISPGPIETPYTLTVPSTGWASIDIPLSSFAPVDLSNIIQLKFDGNGDIYLDNIYFK